MDNPANISSEEQLLGLRNEGKISEAEYADLLTAMRKTPPNVGKERPGQSDETSSKRKLGKLAFNLMLGGIGLPIVAFLISFAISTIAGLGEMDAVFAWCVIICVLIEIPAFVLGVISWPDVYGKAAVASSAALAVVAFILF